MSGRFCESSSRKTIRKTNNGIIKSHFDVPMWCGDAPKTKRSAGAHIRRDAYVCLLLQQSQSISQAMQLQWEKKNNNYSNSASSSSAPMQLISTQLVYISRRNILVLLLLTVCTVTVTRCKLRSCFDLFSGLFLFLKMRNDELFVRAICDSNRIWHDIQ